MGGAVIPATCLTFWTLVLVSGIFALGKALVLVSVTTVFLLPPASLVLGIVAALRIRRSDGVLKGMVFVVLAIGFGVVWLLAPLAIAVLG